MPGDTNIPGNNFFPDIFQLRNFQRNTIYRVCAQSIDYGGQRHVPEFVQVRASDQSVARVQYVILNHEETDNTVQISLIADYTLVLEISQSKQTDQVCRII